MRLSNGKSTIFLEYFEILRVNQEDGFLFLGFLVQSVDIM